MSPKAERKTSGASIKGRTLQQNSLKSDNILNWQNRQPEEIVDVKDEDFNKPNEFPKALEQISFLSILNEAIVNGILEDSDESDVNGKLVKGKPVVKDILVVADSEQETAKTPVYGNVTEAIANVKGPKVFVYLSDIEKVENSGLEKIGKERYLLKQTKEMMAMKPGSKMNVTKSPIKDKGVALTKHMEDRNEDDLSLKDLKSAITLSDKTILESDKQEPKSNTKSAPVTPKRGRKPKSAENSTTKSEKEDKKPVVKRGRKDSPASASEHEKGTDAGSNKDLVTPDRKDKVSADSNNKQLKGSASPRRPRKDKDTSDSSNTGTPDSGNKKKNKTPTQSPSPSRKQSPKKASVKASNDSEKKAKADDKVGKGKESVEKKSPKKKDPSKVKKPEDNSEAFDKHSKSSSSKKSPLEKSSKGRKKDAESDTTPDSKSKTPTPVLNSASPKGSGKKSTKKNASPTNGAVRALDFKEDAVKEKILQSAKLNLPEDFKYEYKSSKSDSGVDLNCLIDKVNSALKEKDEQLTALFGSADDLTASSPETNETGDSDKTMTEFDEANKLDESGSTNVSSEDVSMEGIENDTEKVADEEKMDTDSKGNSLEVTSKDEDAQNDSGDSSEDEESADESDDVTEKDESNINLVKNETTVQNQAKKNEEVVDEIAKSVNIFEMFGLKLKRSIKKETSEKEDENQNEEVKHETLMEKEDIVDTVKDKFIKESVDNDDDEDVIMISEPRANESIVISDDDETLEIDRSGYLSLNETQGTSKCKPKFTTVNNIVEPKPLDILSWPERSTSNDTAFCSEELEEYIEENKENQGSVTRSPKTEAMKAKLKDELEKSEADIDDIDGFVFVSFENKQVLRAHVVLEQRKDWMTDGVLKKLAQLKMMKERQMDVGSKRVTDVKSLDEQKQSFRGVPMRMLRYQKLLKQEYENILLGRPSGLPDKSPSKTPQKTTDITKIKGWKAKYQTTEELQEATGINISESGKVHWKTEERLLKNLDPEDVKDIGLDLKKKRRKIVSYTTNKRKPTSNRDGRGDSKEIDYEYELDESVVTERDVYNEEDEKPLPDKIPYSVKYLSQHKYGMRKLFVKKMRLDAEDERILKKLGTQKLFLTKEEEEERLLSKVRKSKLGIGKLTQSMAFAAVSAVNKKLITKAKKLSKVGCCSKPDNIDCCPQHIAFIFNA